MRNHQDRTVKKIMYSKVTGEPAVEPIILADAKLYLKVDDTTEDDLIEILIQSAREIVEQRTGRSLITQERTVKLDWFPLNDTIRLPFGTVQSVDSIEYYDANDDLVTMDAADYWTDLDSDIPRVVVKNYWPDTYTKPNAVIITYTAGYGDTGADVPAPLRKAMLFILGHLYENRQEVIMSGSSTGVLQIPFGAEAHMNMYILEQNITY